MLFFSSLYTKNSPSFILVSLLSLHLNTRRFISYIIPLVSTLIALLPPKLYLYDQLIFYNLLPNIFITAFFQPFFSTSAFYPV